MHLYLHLGCRVVINLPGLDLAFFDGLEYGVDECGRGLAEWYLAYDECLVVEFFYLCPDLQRASPLSVVILAHVDASSRGEVGIELEWHVVQIGNGCVAQLAEVMRQYFRRQTHGYAFHSLCQQQRELHWQRDGLLVSPVVAHLPFGGLWIEHGVECKLRQSRLYISGCGGTVACEYVSPVTLGVHQQVLLSQLHQGVADGGITVGVKLHSVSHYVCHLVVSSVVHPLHRVEDTPLHGFQSVLDMWHGTLKDDV